MPVFTRFLFVLFLCFNLFSCARREQALYQRSPREQFAKATHQAVAPAAIKILSPEADQPVVANEPLAVSASIKPDVPVRQPKSAWQSTSSTPPVLSKEVTDQTAKHQTKAQLRKAVLKKLVADTPVKTSGLAIAALVCGIISFFLLAVVLGPLAIIFGGVALSKIRKNPDLKGRGLAVAGLVLGIVATVIIIAVLASR